MPTGLNFSSVHHAYQHPEAFGQPQNQEWSSNPSSDANGRPTWSDSKTVHDPCPAGWRVTMEGRIGYEEKGANGFGYDPIFFLPEYGCTSAELSMEEKNKISHRGKALQAIKEELR